MKSNLALDDFWAVIGVGHGRKLTALFGLSGLDNDVWLPHTLVWNALWR